MKLTITHLTDESRTDDSRVFTLNSVAKPLSLLATFKWQKTMKSPATHVIFDLEMSIKNDLIRS